MGTDGLLPSPDSLLSKWGFSDGDVLTDTAPELAPPATDQPPPRVAHIVRRRHEGSHAANEVLEAMVEGTPVEALCGHVWVPTRDPERYPVCTRCLAEADKDTPPPHPEMMP